MKLLLTHTSAAHGGVRTCTLPRYVLSFIRAVQGRHTPISTRTTSAHVPRHAPNGVIRPITVQYDHARARAVSDRLSDLCRHERRFRSMSVQASSGGSAGGVAGPGPFNRPREGRPAPSPHGGRKGRIRPQRRSSRSPQAQAAVLVALFIARRLGEATASEKAGVIRTAHAQLKKLKAMGGKGGFAELAN